MAGEKTELLCVNKEDQDNKNTQCMICHGIMDNPFVTICCGKSFCEACIKTYKENKPECPNCKHHLSTHINRSLRDIINAQQVYCTHKSEGCGWVGDRGDHENHLNSSCDLHSIECKYKCGYECLGKDMEKHFAENYQVHAQIQNDRIETLEKKLRTSNLDIRSKQDRIKTREVQLKKYKLFLYAVMIITPVILGGYYMYIQPPNIQTPEEPHVQHISTGISQFVVLKSSDQNCSWQLNIDNYLHFTIFSTLVQKINLTMINLVFGTKTKARIDGMKASIIVQVLNTKGPDHHVARMDIQFRASKEDWFQSETTKLIDMVGLDTKFYNETENAFLLRIVNIEMDMNNHLPLHFSMCHFKHYQESDHLLWNTFPFYLDHYKFMIYVHANGEGNSTGKALSMTLYRMKSEKDEILPDKVTTTKIIIQLVKKGSGRTFKKFSVTRKASQRVHEGIKVDFQRNSRFEQYGIRSEHGVSLTIPHSDLDQYIDHDCFIFTMTSKY